MESKNVSPMYSIDENSVDADHLGANEFHVLQKVEKEADAIQPCTRAQRFYTSSCGTRHLISVHIQSVESTVVLLSMYLLSRASYI